MKKGKLLVISGFSGVGKGTVVKYLKEHKDTYKVSVSVTTREPRPNEIPGSSLSLYFKWTVWNDD